MTGAVFLVEPAKCLGCYSCVLACRLAMHEKGGEAWCTLLELSSEKEEKTLWLPYLCVQAVEEELCGAKGLPPCAEACVPEAIRLADKGLPELAGAKPLPSLHGKPRAYLVGGLPEDVELPSPGNLLPRRRLPL